MRSDGQNYKTSCSNYPAQSSFAKKLENINATLNSKCTSH